MKKIFPALKPSLIFALMVLSFIACDKDFNSIDSDVLGKSNANFNTTKINVESVLGYNKKLNNTQVNGLNSNLLGVYKDPIYGLTTASILTQITPVSYNPDFGDNATIDSVVLNIPYFSRQDGVDDNGNATYVMNERDSLYGTEAIKLSIYRNNYFLRDFNPNSQSQETQNYYSFAENTPNTAENFIVTESGSVNFDAYKGALIYESDTEGFFPSNASVITKTGEGDEATFNFAEPAFRIKLDTLFWRTAIFDVEGGNELSNSNNFKNYFRGLYFKAEAINDDGNMILLNLSSSSATITIHYSKDSTTEDDARIPSTYVFNFSGIKINTLTNDFSTAPEPLVDGNRIEGDQRLYLKGTAGSMAVIDLFGGDPDNNGIPDALEQLRSEFLDADNNPIKLINEAHLVLTEVPELTGGTDHTFDRLYAYDIKNNQRIIDYELDPTGNTTFPASSILIHLGVRDTLSLDPLIYGYKIRVTEHVKNLVFRDSTNTKIGLVISNNVNYTDNVDLLNSTDDVSEVPAATQLTNRGTVLYGSNTAESGKLKLEIYYSEPND
ncbi:DUF4270 domain-containing protein [Aestuariivivens sediminicola]|uniref:DUF4270 domain-containing protein n=1 Tax=Aestuariivivens sediminicola TaxID=2913560 RepID=UPI001F565D28|nr:DUF4270 domain-containing protein [Aestuariivivens sediminicola]